MSVNLNPQKTSNNHSTPGCCAFLSNFKKQLIELIKCIFCCFPWAHSTPPKNISSAQFPSETDAQQQKVETVKKKILPSAESDLPIIHPKNRSRTHTQVSSQANHYPAEADLPIIHPKNRSQTHTQISSQANHYPAEADLPIIRPLHPKKPVTRAEIAKHRAQIAERYGFLLEINILISILL